MLFACAYKVYTGFSSRRSTAARRGQGARLFLVADGRRVEMEYGQAWATIDGESVVTIVAFGEDNAPPLLGAYTLEGAGSGGGPLLTAAGPRQSHHVLAAARHGQGTRRWWCREAPVTVIPASERESRRGMGWTPVCTGVTLAPHSMRGRVSRRGVVWATGAFLSHAQSVRMKA